MQRSVSLSNERGTGADVDGIVPCKEVRRCFCIRNHLHTNAVVGASCANENAAKRPISIGSMHAGH